MALHSIDEEGNLTWHCSHWPEEDEKPCGTHNTAHISHEAIQWSGQIGTQEKRQLVRLPPCSDCQSTTFLKVHFSERELKAPNMWLEWNSERMAFHQRLQELLPQAEPGSTQEAMLKSQIAELEAIRDAGGVHTASHAIAQNHMELARQLKEAGKLPVGTEQGE